jgi:hypothetical protein
MPISRSRRKSGAAFLHKQGKEKQWDCLLFLFLVLQFASGVLFLVFFALFARTMCGAGKGVLGDFLRLQRKLSPMFPEFRKSGWFFASSTEIFANAL